MEGNEHGKLTATKIRYLRESGNYGDGDRLLLRIADSGKGYWIILCAINGRRQDIGLGSLSLVSLAEAREAAYLFGKGFKTA